MREGKSDVGLLSPLGLGPEGTFCNHVCGSLIQQSPEGEEAAPVVPAPPSLPAQAELPSRLPLQYLESLESPSSSAGERHPCSWLGTRRPGLGQRIGCVPAAGCFSLQISFPIGAMPTGPRDFEGAFLGVLRIPAPLWGLGTSPAPQCLWRWRGAVPSTRCVPGPGSGPIGRGRDPGPQFPHVPADQA